MGFGSVLGPNPIRSSQFSFKKNANFQAPSVLGCAFALPAPKHGPTAVSKAPYYPLPAHRMEHKWNRMEWNRTMGWGANLPRPGRSFPATGRRSDGGGTATSPAGLPRLPPRRAGGLEAGVGWEWATEPVSLTQRGGAGKPLWGPVQEPDNLGWLSRSWRAPPSPTMGVPRLELGPTKKNGQKNPPTTPKKNQFLKI